MEFLLLWSGDKPGMKKCRIASFENTVGTVGHWRNGKLYLPNPDDLRAAIPYRYLKAYDNAVNWFGLPQIWQDARNNNAPLAIHLNRSGKRYKQHLITLYLQPLKDS